MWSGKILSSKQGAQNCLYQIIDIACYILLTKFLVSLPYQIPDIYFLIDYKKYNYFVMHLLNLH
jgi:hypothetical protein